MLDALRTELAIHDPAPHCGWQLNVLAAGAAGGLRRDLPVADCGLQRRMAYGGNTGVATTVPQLSHFLAYSGCCSADRDIAYHTK